MKIETFLGAARNIYHIGLSLEPFRDIVFNPIVTKKDYTLKMEMLLGVVRNIYDIDLSLEPFLGAVFDSILTIKDYTLGKVRF